MLEKLGRKGMKLTEHEGIVRLSCVHIRKFTKLAKKEIIAAQIVHPDDIPVCFSGVDGRTPSSKHGLIWLSLDVGGLEKTVAALRESVIYPLVYPSIFPAHQYASQAPALFTAPKGVLLHGPPGELINWALCILLISSLGCGKTLLAKALAKESHTTFINVPFSVLTYKWYGESNKLVHALFDVARKLAPSIIVRDFCIDEISLAYGWGQFVDEIDMFLRERGSGDHEVTGMMKAEWASSLS
jgi:hypothetical protein